MNTLIKSLLCLFLLSGLNACKIDLDIFGKGSVQTQSGSFDCTSDGSTQSGDCTQTYNIDEEAEACNPESEDCTIVGENDVVTETWVATPEEGNGFGGFTGHCDGAGSCTHVIDETHANLEQNVLIEAHFAPEPPPEEVTYTHNYLGQMASMTVNGVTTFYVYDEQGRTLSEINESGVSIKDYIYAEEELVAWVEKSGDTGDSETEEQVFYPFTNHLGQVYITVRADVKMGHEQYTDPFGRVQAMYIDKTLGVDNVGPLPLVDGLPGQRLQPSGYYDNWHRTYHDGRYLQPDPIGLRGGMNPYLYANANPVMFIDPYGLYPGQWFDSMGEATADAASYIGDLAGQQGWKYEYGATFYDNGDKECPKYTYYFTSQYQEREVTLGMPPNGQPPLGFMHNHPSGNPNPSGQDQLVADSQSRKHGTSVPITAITQSGASKTYHGSRSGRPGSGSINNGY